MRVLHFRLGVHEIPLEQCKIMHTQSRFYPLSVHEPLLQCPFSNPPPRLPVFLKLGVFMLSGAPFTTARAQTNLALDRPAVASSAEDPVGLAATQATDGELGTRWASEWTAGEWIYVDLGAETTFRRVRLWWEAA